MNIVYIYTTRMIPPADPSRGPGVIRITPRLEALSRVGVGVFCRRIIHVVVLGRTSVGITHTLGMPGKAHRDAPIRFGLGESWKTTRLDLVPNPFRRDSLATGILMCRNIPE